MDYISFYLALADENRSKIGWLVNPYSIHEVETERLGRKGDGARELFGGQTTLAVLLRPSHRVPGWPTCIRNLIRHLHRAFNRNSEQCGYNQTKWTGTQCPIILPHLSKKKKKKKKYGLFSIHRTDTGFSPALSSWKPDQQQTCGLSPSRCSCTGNVVAEQGREPVLIISVVAYAFA